MPIAFQNLNSVADARTRFERFNESEQEILQICAYQIELVQVQIGVCVSRKHLILLKNVIRQ